MGAVSLILVAHHAPLLSNKEGRALKRFCRAVVRSYLPLMSLLAEHQEAVVTVALSAGLIDMLADPELQQGVDAHLEALIERSRVDQHEHSVSPVVEQAAVDQERLERLQQVFREVCGRDLVATLVNWAREGRVELIPIAGSHAILPLIEEEAIRCAHIHAAQQAFEARLGISTRAIWLPEGAVSDEVVATLADAGVSVAAVDKRALQGHGAVEVGGTRLVGVSSELSGVLEREHSFSRARCADGDWGYTTEAPAQGLATFYREEAAHAHAVESATLVHERLEEADEVQLVAWSLDRLGERQAEWPVALGELLRRCHSGSVEPVALSRAASRLEAMPAQRLALSSLGWRGLTPWLSPSNQWLYRHLHRLERQLVEVASGKSVEQDRRGRLAGWEKRAVQVALGELMLAQCSDWAAAMHAGFDAEEAIKRAKGHIGNAGQLLEQVERGAVDQRLVERLELRSVRVVAAASALTAAADSLSPHR